MKKAYVKPALYAERFAIAEHVAACAYQTTFGTNCPIIADEVTFFTSEPPCNEDGMMLITGAGLELSAVTVEQLINVVNPTCYNSLQDYHQLFVS